jgi:hypothetical protein
MWSFEFFAGSTIYFDEARSWHFATIAWYETHTEKKDTDIRVEDILTLEGGLGKSSKDGALSVGAAYYAQWKLTEEDLGTTLEGNTFVVALTFPIPKSGKKAVRGAKTQRLNGSVLVGKGHIKGILISGPRPKASVLVNSNCRIKVALAIYTSLQAMRCLLTMAALPACGHGCHCLSLHYSLGNRSRAAKSSPKVSSPAPPIGLTTAWTRSKANAVATRTGVLSAENDEHYRPLESRQCCLMDDPAVALGGRV